MSSALSACPRCGVSLFAPSEACPKCGVILAKAVAAARKPRLSDVVVTTGDLKREYRIIALVYTQVSNKGLFGSRLDELCAKHKIPLAEQGPDLLSTFAHIAIGEFPAGQQHLSRAFAVCVQELREQALKLDADAVIWVRQETELDTTGFQFFYMQLYGTAVRQL